MRGLAALALSLLLASPALAARTLRVAAAASLTDAFTELGRAFERREPGWSVEFEFAGSQALATQLELGAPSDVFASADERWMEYASRHDLLEGYAVEFAGNRLVVVAARRGVSGPRTLADLARPGTRLVIGAESVPVGRYAREVIRNLEAPDRLGAGWGAGVRRNVVSEEENVRAIVGKVQLGEAAAGIVYATDVTPAVARASRIIEIPAEANVTASYPIAVARASRDAAQARRFVEFVCSAAGQAVLARHGFAPPARSAR
jgi:molybdate transport system substrate-binding protein